MIFCIGNSHVNTFSGFGKLSLDYSGKIFSGYNIGPVIAYNFLENHLDKVLGVYKNKGWDKIESSYLSLIVGEVDCRLHIPKHADELCVSDYDMVLKCVNRFFRCYEKLLNLGIKCVAFSTHPTTTQSHNMGSSECPVYGNWERRNRICLMWNSSVEQYCKDLSIPYISFYKYLVYDDNKTNMSYFLDYCHLNSSKVMPFIIKELEANSVFKEWLYE